MAKSLLIIFEKLWQHTEGPTDQQKGNIIQFFKKGKQKGRAGELQPHGLTPVPRKVMEWIFLETMLKLMVNMEMTCESQQYSTKGKLCLTKLVAFYKRVTVLIGKEKVANIIC